jgi:dTDP-4-amino-4,6-dideoxygalactose transaminase
MQLGIPLISDCAQAIGSGISGRSLLEFGEMSITSFGPTKFMTSGLGGAVLFDGQDGAAIQRLAMSELSVAEYQAHGFVRTLGQHVSDLNAGLALAQLEHVDTFVQRRKRIAGRYEKALRAVPSLDFPKKIAGAEPNWFRYYFLSDHAHEWQRRLEAVGIDARLSISHIMTDYFPQVGTRNELSRQAHRVVSLPIYPGLKNAQVTRIVEALQRVAAEIKEAMI